MPANPRDFALGDGVGDELEGTVLVGVGVKNVGDAVVDTPLEPAIQILVNACKIVTVIISNVGVGLSSVVAEAVEMVVVPVFLGE